MPRHPRTAGRMGRPWRRLQQWVWANFTHCYRCGEYVNQAITNPRHPRARSVDHIVPLWLGGDPCSRDNATLSHLGCNSRAGADMRHAHRKAMATPPKGTPSREW